MNWKKKEEFHAPFLDEIGSYYFPRSFYVAFSVVFGDLRSAGEIFIFLTNMNKLMIWKKGGGEILKSEITKLRYNGDLGDIPDRCFYDKHHVVPQSRDRRLQELKVDQVVKVPEVFHEAWHIMFWNLYGDEIKYFLELLLYFTIEKRKVVTHEILQKTAKELVEKNGRIIRA